MWDSTPAAGVWRRWCFSPPCDVVFLSLHALKTSGSGAEPREFKKKVVFWFSTGLFNHILFRMTRFFDTEEAIEVALINLRQNRCPWCGTTGALTRHDAIWKYGAKQYGLRGRRVFCDPDGAHAQGCGRTHTLWLSETLLGRSLCAMVLMRFILGLLSGASTQKAWQDADTGMSPRSGYRTLKWLENIQSIIRTRLFGLSPPSPSGNEKTPLLATLKVLKEAFGNNAVSDYQKKLQKSFS